MKTNEIFTRKTYTLSAGDYQLKLGLKTNIMGVINLTPDSFSQDGWLKKNSSLKKSHELAIAHGLKLIAEGADIIDVGGESTRPGAKAISEEEEIKRVIPVIRQLAKKTKVPISVDTYKPHVIQMALDAGATMVNNIMGVRVSTQILKMVCNYNAAIVLMHIKGIPRTMQKNIRYKNLMAEIISALGNSVENCLEIGISFDRITIDPGIGFGKSVEHNLQILRELKKFSVLDLPILIGTSRKSFIGKILNCDVKERLYGTMATVCASILNGAHIVRVHDVKEMVHVARMSDAIINPTAKL